MYIRREELPDRLLLIFLPENEEGMEKVNIFIRSFGWTEKAEMTLGYDWATLLYKNSAKIEKNDFFLSLSKNPEKDKERLKVMLMMKERKASGSVGDCLDFLTKTKTMTKKKEEVTDKRNRNTWRRWRWRETFLFLVVMMMRPVTPLYSRREIYLKNWNC